MWLWRDGEKVVSTQYVLLGTWYFYLNCLVFTKYCVFLFIDENKVGEWNKGW